MYFQNLINILKRFIKTIFELGEIICAFIKEMNINAIINFNEIIFLIERLY